MSTGRRIRITDLRQPELTDIQTLALDHGERHPVELTRGGGAGRRRGPHRSRRLRSRRLPGPPGPWLAEVDGDPERTGLGRMTLFRDCVRYAGNRLRIHDLLGPPSRDRRCRDHRARSSWSACPVRAPPIWSTSIAADTPPALPPACGRATSPSPTRRRGSARPTPVPIPATGGPRSSGRAWRRCCPYMAAMHPMRPDHVHEELELQLPDFSSYQLEWVARAPRWRDYYLAHDQTPHYAYLKTVLQILQWRRTGGERWVLKSPQHLEQLGPAARPSSPMPPSSSPTATRCRWSSRRPP